MGIQLYHDEERFSSTGLQQLKCVLLKSVSVSISEHLVSYKTVEILPQPPCKVDLILTIIFHSSEMPEGNGHEKMSGGHNCHHIRDHVQDIQETPFSRLS